MQPVEIMPIQDSLVLRARGSELLILAQHISELKQRKSKRDFSIYFTGEALVNRPARKLFEAWLRKDGTLWERLFQLVHEMEQTGTNAEGLSDEQPAVRTKNPPLTAKSTVIEPAVEVVEAKAVSKADKKPEKAAKTSTSVAKSASPKTTKSTAEKSSGKTTGKASPAKKSTATKTAKPAAKAATAKTGTTKTGTTKTGTTAAKKSAAKTASKTSAKSSSASKAAKSSSSSKAAGKTAAKKR